MAEKEEEARAPSGAAAGADPAEAKMTRSGILCNAGFGGSGDGSNSAAQSPRSGPQKAVSILEPDTISPIMLADSKHINDEFSLDRPVSSRQHRAKSAGKFRSRNNIDPSKSPYLSAQSPYLTGQQSAQSISPALPPQQDQQIEKRSQRLRNRTSASELHARISQWLEAEKTRRRSRSDKTAFKPSDVLAKLTKRASREKRDDGPDADTESRRSSDAAIDDLAQILQDFSHSSRRGSTRSLTRRSSLMKLRRMSTAASSDTEYFDGDRFVPDCDGWLDNSKTMACENGDLNAIGSASNVSRRAREQQAWSEFKYEIVRLTHTLRLKGWRRVPMDRTDDITVERLSGALTNAVYVVSPPKDLPARKPSSQSLAREEVDPEQQAKDNTSASYPRSTPKKLLLRIYGPQVEHLIDRDSELSILKRLCRKNIGPNLLGTFANGRFEQFLHATALTPEAMREPETSQQIAKRMRELHDGIELLYEERAAGPWVWQNWDKWEERCGMVVDYIDCEKESEGTARARRGSKVGKEYVCGTEWAFFVKVVKKYRKWVLERYGGWEKLRSELCFTHNDTQYGNILRLLPPSNSPLLRPVNQHKTLSVIDFEYANANTRGLEFANHFTEWTYNYHDAARPHACNHALYPTVEEQLRFLRAYVGHYRVSGQSRPNTPAFGPTTPGSGSASGGGGGGVLTTAPSSGSISAFMLDARTPAGAVGAAAGAAQNNTDLERVAREEEEAREAEVQRLLEETRVWRMANSAQWVAWGIVQAKVDGLPVMPGDEDGAAGAEAGRSGGEMSGGPDDGVVTGEGRRMVNASANGNPIGPVDVGNYAPAAAMVMMSDRVGDDEERRRIEGDFEGKRPDRFGRPDEQEQQGPGEEEEGFDYLAYAHERALLFWGDAVLMGMVEERELPAGLAGKLKKVDY